MLLICLFISCPVLNYYFSKLCTFSILVSILFISNGDKQPSSSTSFALNNNDIFLLTVNFDKIINEDVKRNKSILFKSFNYTSVSFW